VLNAFYGRREGRPADAVVVAGDTAPFGDRQAATAGSLRRKLTASCLCLFGNDAAAAVSWTLRISCGSITIPTPSVVAHTRRRVTVPDDVSIPDMAKLERPLAVAERTGRALPAGTQANLGHRGLHTTAIRRTRTAGMRARLTPIGLTADDAIDCSDNAARWYI